MQCIKSSLQLVAALICLLCIFSCGDNGTHPPGKASRASKPAPAMNETSVPIAPALSWESKGAELFHVYFAATNSVVLVGETLQPVYDPGSLAVNRSYYWRVDSINSAGSTMGDLWTFRTSDGRPGSPGGPVPSDNTTNVDVDILLEWSEARDADGYWVYFATDPALLASNFKGVFLDNSYDPGPLDVDTSYYWRIIAFNSIGSTAAPLWAFSTGAETLSANFDATNRSGIAPLNVNFIDNSTGTVTTWAWDFDNDGTVDSTLQNPSHTYQSPGTYSVSLVVSGPAGSDTLVRADYVTAFSASGGVYFVNDDTGSDSFDGLTPSTAFQTISKGLEIAVEGESVIVADGVYTGTYNKYLSFDGEDIHLSSINGPGNCIIDLEGSGRAFLITGQVTDAAIIEGFTIKNGLAVIGGGVYCMNSDPTIRDCLFLDCDGQSVAGALYFYNSSSLVTNCTFISCNSSIYGGAIRIYYGSITITDCLFVNNTCVGSTSYGGAMFISDGSHLVTRCTFDNNTAGRFGGAVCVDIGCVVEFKNCRFRNNQAQNNGGGAFSAWTDSRPTFVGCIFDNNSAVSGGAIYLLNNSAAYLVNCTIAQNTASGDGGGCRVRTASNMNLFNTIVWNNTAGNGNQFYTDSDVSLLIYYCDIQDATSSDIISSGSVTYFFTIYSDPLFSNPASGVFRLGNGSLAIDRGNNVYLPGGYTIDISGATRVVNGTVDIGALERP